jgi:hypothetical protein
MATRLLLNGSEFQVNVDNGGGNGISGNQFLPDAATLTDGRFAIGYESNLFGGADHGAIARIVDSSVTYVDVFFNAGSIQSNPALAPRLDGGFGVAFTNQSHADNTADATGPNITYRTVSATGALGTPLAIGDFNFGAGHDQLFRPDIATLSTTGHQVVVFERISTLATNHDIFLNVINATGNATLFPANNPLQVSNTSEWEGAAKVAASGNRAVVAYEKGPDIANANICVRGYNGDSNLLGPEFKIADHAERLQTPAIAALADNRYVVIYTDLVDIFGCIVDPETPVGPFFSDEFRIDNPGGSVAAPSVAATVDGGFIATWHESNGSTFDVLARRFDAHGQSYGDIFTVNTLTDNNQLTPTVATSGTGVVFAWTDVGSRATDASPSGVRAQLFTTTAFDYDSARLGDLDGDGRADILFQNDNGNAGCVVWQTDEHGSVSSISAFAPLPAGFRIFGTGDFNSTPGDDMLLRNGPQLAIWSTSGGFGLNPHIVIGSTSPDYHNAGIGDFTGDGQEDLLFRNDAGQIVTWGVVNDALAIPPQILGSTAAVYHVVGIDDLTGDHQADILFRHDNGDIALWQVANNQLVNAPKVIGSTSPSYHIVSTADFDGNGAKDILFRGDNGDLVEWLLNSAGDLLGAPTPIGNAALTFHVDGTGDLNGDGRDDIILRDADGTLVEWLMNGTSFAAPPALLGHMDVDFAIAAHHFDVV